LAFTTLSEEFAALRGSDAAEELEYKEDRSESCDCENTEVVLCEAELEASDGRESVDDADNSDFALDFRSLKVSLGALAGSDGDDDDFESGKKK
jgi:hypothetical protein